MEALRDAETPNRLHVVDDGVEAMAFLRACTPKSPRPDLIFLDLNLPRKDGREVLEEIKHDDALKHIPVIVLTTSQADQDILRSYHLRANAYVTKPVDLDQFFKAIKSIDLFWLGTAKFASLPGGRDVDG
jgi:CheY-like chemotaxis protein